MAKPLKFSLLRVKNESRWIARVIKAAQVFCEIIIIFDDHSEDETVKICESLGCIIYRSEFEGLSEGRDKDFLLSRVWFHGGTPGDWVAMLDGDEILNVSDLTTLENSLKGTCNCFSLPIIYLWDQEDQVRVDRWYSKFHRPSIFRLTDYGLSFQKNSNGGGFHCGSVPQQLMPSYELIQVRILHLGYLHREDRIRKYNWYNSQIPIPPSEDHYRHMVVGDVFPATSKFMHAGPLELKSLQEFVPGAVL